MLLEEDGQFLIIENCHRHEWKHHSGAHPIAVWDVTLMSAQSMYLAKWMLALEQVTALSLENHQLYEIVWL